MTTRIRVSISAEILDSK